jgi:hypothetical protein
MDLEYKITTTADLTGAERAADSLEQLKLRLAQLNEEQRIANVQGITAVGLDQEIAEAKTRLAAALRSEVVPAVELENLSHRETRRVLDVIGNVAAPGAGRALGELAYGPVGAALALAGAFEYLRSKIDEVAKQEEDLNEQELSEHQKNIEALQTAWDNTQKALGDYYAALATAGDEKDPTKKQLDNIKAVTDAQIESSKKIIEALGKQEVAYLRAHGGSPDQIADAEARTQSQVRGLDADKANADGPALLQLEQQKRLAQDAQLQRDAIAAEQQAAAAKAANDKNARELAGVNDQLDPSTKPGKALKEKQEAAATALKNAQEMPDQVADVSPAGGVILRDNTAAKAAAIAKAQEDIAVAAAARLVERQKQLQDNEFALQEKEKETAKRASDANATSTTNRARLKELPGDINQAQQVQGINQTGDAIVDKINERDATTGQTLGAMGAAAHLNQSQIIEIARELLAGQLTHAQEIAGLKALAAQLQQKNAQLSSAVDTH